MGEAATEPPKLTLGKLKEVVTDADELAKGARLVDDQGLTHLSRHQARLYAEARGSGAAPYKVQVHFEDKVKGRCSCMAARSRPFCKHAAALLVAWARTPEAFAVSEVAPAALAGPGGAKKKAVKAGATDAAELMGGGVKQAATLARELALSGVASVGAERAEQVAALATSLREARLRRLSARTLAMSEAVALAASGSDAFDAPAYAELFADLVLTVRKLEKHLGGEALEPRHVEELIGKTWTRKDRAPVEGLELVEYAFLSRVTPDDFLIRESRFVDLKSGRHYSEKQILPGFLARRAEAKPSHQGFVLEGAKGSQYPSFEPLRLDLEDPAARSPLDAAALQRLEAAALPSVTAALAAFQERRRDVFAPDTLPVAVRVETVLAEGRRLQVVDAEGGALFLPDDPTVAEHLASSLRGVRLVALLGEVALDGALPTLYPLAALVRTAAGPRLVTVTTRDLGEVAATAKVKVAAGRAALKGAQRPSWAEVARASGVSTAAIALGEVRDELAQALASGLGSLGPRLAQPLSARLKELGLAKQAELLDGLAAKADPAERVDDFVKLYQVLGIALTRLSGATHVERSRLVAVPTFESVQVARSEERLEPRRIAEAVAEGRLNRYQAAVRYAAWYDGVPVETLAESLYPTWADGSAQPFVARVFASRGPQALEAAGAALSVDTADDRYRRRPLARMVRLTALKVLEAEGSADAATLLARFEARVTDRPLKALARRALREVRARLGQGPSGLSAAELETLARLRAQLHGAPRKEAREEAAHALADEGLVEAIPHLRASLLGDVATGVREAAAHALGRLGDAESVEHFVGLVQRRHEDWEGAKLGAWALSHLGDVRGTEALLDAWAEGWQPAILGEALGQVGMAVLEPLVDRVEREPELLKKKAALAVVGSLPGEEVAAALLARAEREQASADFVERALVWLQLASVQPGTAKALAQGLLKLRPGLEAKGASKEEKALYRKVKAALE